DAEVVEVGESGVGVAEGPVAVREKDDGEGGVAAGVGGDPPAGELRGGGFVGAEADEFVGDAGDGLRAVCGACGVQDKLPLALVEDPAEGEIAAKDRCDNGEGDGFDEPDGTDDLG